MKVGITYYVLFGFIPVTLLDQGMNCHFSLTSSRPCDVYKEAEEESEVMVDGTSTGGQASILSKESIELLTDQMLSGKNA